MEPDGWTLWLALAAAGAAGYFLVSKAIDFFRRGSSWSESTPSSPTSSMPPSYQPSASMEEEMQEDQSRFESNKPIG